MTQLSASDAKSFFTGLSLFHNAPERAIEIASGFARERRYPSDTELFREGETGDAMYILADGLIKLAKVDLGGHEKTLAMLRPPEFFGEMALLGHGTRSASALTLEPSRCFLIYRDDFGRLLEAFPQITLNLSSALADRLRGMDDEAQILSYKDASARVSYVLLRLYRGGVVALHEGFGRVHLTHQDLANLAGTSRETVTRALRALETDGLIATRPKEIDLLDLGGLEEVLHGIR